MWDSAVRFPFPTIKHATTTLAKRKEKERKKKKKRKKEKKEPILPDQAWEFRCQECTNKFTKPVT